MSWVSFRAATRKDLLRLLLDPVALLMWIGIPLVIGTMITLALGGSSGSRPKARLLLADLDRSLVSKLLVGALGGQGSQGVVELEEVAEAEGRARMEDGQASALLVLPEGFGRALLEERDTRLLLLTNPSQRILPAIIEEMLEILADGSFYLHRVFGEELRQIALDSDSEQGPSAEEVAAMSVAIHGIVQKIERYLFPPVIELDFVTKADEREGDLQQSLALLFLPGVLTMSLFFAAQGMSEDIWRERNQGILRRLCSTPHSPVLYLLARCTACATLFLLLSGLGLAIGMGYHGLPLSRLPLCTAWSALAGTLLLALMLVLQLCARSQRAGSVLTNSVLFPLLMIGGSFFPLDAMPATMAAVGRYTPNGWAVEVLAELMLGTGSTPLFLRSAAILVAGSIPLFVLAALRLRGGFARAT